MKKTFILWIFFVFALVLLTACGSKEAEIENAIESANIQLSENNCQAAISTLESIGRQNTNANYLKTLASAYACRASYSTIKFFDHDVALTTTPSPIGGMARYSTSKHLGTQTLAESQNYKDLDEAIKILLYAGGITQSTQPSSLERAKYFNQRELGDLNAQLAYMIMVQLGKYLKYYSNADDLGFKGNGDFGSSCFTDYTINEAAIKFYITNGSKTGVCNSLNQSHPELAIGASNRRVKLCQGVILLNNVLDVLPAVIAAAGNGKLNDIEQIVAEFQSQKEELENIDPYYGPVATTLNQSKCESDTDINEETLSAYFALFFESLIH